MKKTEKSKKKHKKNGKNENREMTQTGEDFSSPVYTIGDCCSLNRVPTHVRYPIQLFTRNLHTGNHILYDREHTALFDLKISPKSSVTRSERNVEILEIFKSKSAVCSWQ